MPAAVRFDPLDLAVRRTRKGRIEVQVLNAAGPLRPISPFRSPWAPEEIAVLLEQFEGQISRDLGARPQHGAPPPNLREVGEKLFKALFHDEVERLLEQHLARLTSVDAAVGLRLRLYFDPELADVAALPWELLYHPQRRQFFGQNLLTVLSRWLPIDRLMAIRPVRLPLKVVLVAPEPAHLAPLDLREERERLLKGLASYREVEVVEVQPPTLERLVEILEEDSGFHILHFMGHGVFDPASEEGVLLFEGPHGCHRVSGEVLATNLAGCSALQLVVLNACRSGQISRKRGQDPFTGVATALLLAGVPAVVAMQRAISDQAALTFCGKLYSRLAAGDPVDLATTRARLAIFNQSPHTIKWITPVLYLQVADGRILVPEETPIPPLVVHLLVLGEAAPEADTLEKVIRDLQGRLAPLRISLRHAPADASGQRPDLQVVLWSGRSPVAGTTEAMAAEALVRSGRTGLLCHIHTPAAGSPLAELLRLHPEVSCRFASPAELEEKLRRHLLLRLFNEQLEPPEPMAVQAPAWTTLLPCRLVAADCGSRYLNHSARRVYDRLQRLYRLFNLGASLSREELDVLWAAAYLRLPGGYSRPVKLAWELVEENYWPSELAEPAGSVAEAADYGVSLTDPALHTGPYRLHLLAALLRLSEILDLDRQAVKPGLAGSMPQAGADIADWLAYLTREVRVDRTGIVQFVLDAPAAEWVAPLRQATSLRLEKSWQELRGILLPARLSVAVAPSEVILGAVAEPPSSVLERLRNLGAEVGIPHVVEQHLGEFPSGLLPAILPLPNSAAEGEEILVLDSQQPGLLEVHEEESGSVILHRPIVWDEAEVVLDVADLRSDRWYRWQFHGWGAAGGKILRRLGRLRPLASHLKPLAQAVLPSDPGYKKELLALGLHTRLLRELIPLLESGAATGEDAVLAYRLVSDAYEWVLREAPGCRLLDSYRKAALWIGPLQGGFQ